MNAFVTALTRRPVCASLVAIATTTVLSSVAQATPDLSGVWKITSDQAALTTIDGKTPPLLPAALKSYETTKAQRAAGDLSWDGTSSKCKPPSEPRIMLEQMPFEIMQQSDKLFFSYQWNRLDRFIYLDKPLNVIAPTYFGTSVAKWDGDTLVVDAEGFNDKSFLDRDGMPRTTQLKLTERFSLSADGKTLHERITVDDPGTFSKPWDTELTFARQSAHIVEDVCEERNGMIKTR